MSRESSAGAEERSEYLASLLVLSLTISSLQEGRKGTTGHERSPSMAELSHQEKRGVGTGNKARSG